MEHDQHIDPLATLRESPEPFTLSSSLERATHRLHHRRVRRSVIIGMCVLVVSAIGAWYAFLGPSIPSALLDTVSPTEPTTPLVSTPPAIELSIPSERLARPLKTPTQTILAPRPLLEDAAIATSEMLRSLDVDLAAYHDIRSMLGSSDRVVMVDNTTNRETCIQITCEGGDARSIVCSAPAPSPFRVTALDGGLIFDIERANGSLARGPYVPVRTSIGNDEVILWYENAPDLLAKLKGSAIMPLLVGTYHTVWQRPDNSVVFTDTEPDSQWTSATLFRIDGSEVSNSRIVWHTVGGDLREIAISDVPRGVYELRTFSSGKLMGRELIVVR